MRGARIGIVGTGFIARGVAFEIARTDDLELGPILTRRAPATVERLAREKLTHSIGALISDADLVLECSGDPVYATPIVEELLAAGTPVVTMDSELHVTTGSWLARLGYLTEADGDQPGCLARLHKEALGRGFEPLAYINLKGFLNPKPDQEEMEYWAEKQSIRVQQTVSFTDGSKVEIEKALVANGLGAAIPPDDVTGGRVVNIADTDYLADLATALKGPVSDYIVAPAAPPGIMILAEHPQARTLPEYRPLSRLLTTGGRAYQLLRPHHLCHLEVVSTLREVLSGAPPLLNNSTSPTVGAFAFTKRALTADQAIEGLGGFDVRARAMEFDSADDQNLVPICLMKSARMLRDVDEDRFLTFNDVEIETSRALEIVRLLRDERIAERGQILSLPRERMPARERRTP